MLHIYGACALFELLLASGDARLATLAASKRVYVTYEPHLMLLLVVLGSRDTRCAQWVYLVAAALCIRAN